MMDIILITILCLGWYLMVCLLFALWLELKELLRTLRHRNGPEQFGLVDYVDKLGGDRYLYSAITFPYYYFYVGCRKAIFTRQAKKAFKEYLGEHYCAELIAAEIDAMIIDQQAHEYDLDYETVKGWVDESISYWEP